MHFLDARVRAGMPVVPPLLHMGTPRILYAFSLQSRLCITCQRRPDGKTTRFCPSRACIGLVVLSLVVPGAVEHALAH